MEVLLNTILGFTFGLSVVVAAFAILYVVLLLKTTLKDSKESQKVKQTKKGERNAKSKKIN